MNPILRVSRKELIAALNQLKIGLGRSRGEVMLFTHKDNTLSISVQGISVQVVVEGIWRGTAKIPAKAVISIIKLLPAGDPLTLMYKDGRFHIGTWSIASEWFDISPPVIDLPLNASFLDILAVKNKYNDAELVASGLEEKIHGVEEAIRERIAKASMILEPVGITSGDITRLIEEKLRCKLQES
jgi:hypothetical protein